MRVLIVDDEAPARARLRQMLAPNPEVEIVAEAESGTQTMDLVSRLEPDVLLLDIQMPGCSGIDVAACLPEPRPRIIFCTAFDQHAVDAFERHAVDYLLKPISRARLERALDRVRSLAGTGSEAALDQAVRHQRSAPARFLVRQVARYLVIGEGQVTYFTSEDGLTRLIGENARYWMDPTLNELEQRLDPSRFCRISRGALINLNSVAEVHPLPAGSGEVLMKNRHRLPVSRRRYRDLLAILAGSG
jgi:two-component system LytT family response regulator